MNVLGLLRPIRVRLTLWYTLLLMVALIAFSLALYVVLGVVLREEMDDTLRRDSALVVGNLELDAQRQLTTEPGQSALRGNLLEGEEFWRLLDVSGRLVEQNGVYEMDALPVDLTTLEQALAGREVFETVHTGNHSIRLYTAPVDQSGQVIGVVQLGLSLEEVTETLDTLRWISILVLPVMVAVAGAGGLFLASRALRPVDRIIRTAQLITASDLSQRLEVDVPDDELGRLTRTLNAMIERLDAAFHRQRRFTADASHELRTPLTIIKGDLSLALSRPRDASYYHGVLTEVGEEVSLMSRLVDRLLSLARADAEGISLRRQTLDLGILLANVVEQIRPFAESKGLDLTAQIPRGLMVRADPDAIIEVMFNLLDNAVKYTHSGWVHLTARRRQGNGSEIQLAVSDSGPGIPAKHLSHIFERFYRVDRARSRELGGVGLGLSIARELARAHGGDVTVQSVPGEGSTFTVHLPVE